MSAPVPTRTGALGVTETSGSGWGYFAPVGVLDRFPEPTTSRQPLLLIDLHGVTRVTSAGARAFADALGRLGEGGRNVVLVDCPPPVVALLNLIRGFLGSASVLSIRAPY